MSVIRKPTCRGSQREMYLVSERRHVSAVGPNQLLLEHGSSCELSQMRLERYTVLRRELRR